MNNLQIFSLFGLRASADTDTHLQQPNSQGQKWPLAHNTTGHWKDEFVPLSDSVILVTKSPQKTTRPAQQTL